MRIRKNVYELGAGDETLKWYARAVKVMIARDPESPISWSYQNSIHGGPRQGNPHFEQCQHRSWYFLPWHRGYLSQFESIVADVVKSIGGPDDWALPYWNYSESLTRNPEARKLPEMFRTPSLDDGSPNPLLSRRSAALNSGAELPLRAVTVADLSIQNFTNRPSARGSGIGGGISGFAFMGPRTATGALEDLPHNVLHGVIGGEGGFMLNPRTAPLDPIFWLHHCNIDRLWEIWRQLEGNSDPDDPRWLTGVEFRLPDKNGGEYRFNPSNMLDTSRILDGFVYDSLELDMGDETELAFAASAFSVETGGLEMSTVPENELFASGTIAEGSAIDLLAEFPTGRVVFNPEAVAQSLSVIETELPSRVFLHLDDIKGGGGPGDFEVYVDLANDTLEPIEAGLLTNFGLEVASDPKGTMQGSGLSTTFDITTIAERLDLQESDFDDLIVTFVRRPLDLSDGDVPSELESYLSVLDKEKKISVGRIRLSIN